MMKPIHLAKNPDSDLYFYTESGAEGRAQLEGCYQKQKALNTFYSLDGAEVDASTEESFGYTWLYAVPSEFL